MSKICRTCLRRTNRTVRTSQALGNFGEGSIRISVVLRFCIPELYLGLSSNPEICFSCKENLKVAYLFKKKCLDTENIIGNYLKDVRCTGKSIELHDVLAYINDELKSPVLIQGIPSNNIVSVENAANEPEGPFDCDTVDNENPQVVDVRQSAPNPTNQGNIINFSDCQNLVVNHIKLVNMVQNENDRNHDLSQTVSDVQAQFVVTQNNEKESLHDEDESNNFCKISDVFSLNPDVENTNKNNYETTNLDNDTEMETRMDIKDEPLDIDLNENFNYTVTDEDTLDASETASFKNHCSPSLQEFIDSIPEINHPDQYVDIPDFVTINNFGFKELEEFKLQQVADQTNSKSDQKTSEATPNSVNSHKNDTPVEAPMSEMKVVKVLASAPDVIILNGKRMIKCGNQYKLEEVPATGESLNQNVTQEVQAKTLIVSNRKRNRRKIKIVPVNDQHAEKKFKLDPNSFTKLPKAEDRDVVVLFTNYTSEGDYINDHDYLISPYKRNKVLVEENSQWLCICFICNMRHDVYDHVDHIKTHGTRCMVCSTDLGTPYMLNIHCKTHRKPCRYCTEVVPYGVIKSHEEKHIAEENEILETSKKRVYYARKGRKKLTNDEKPVYFPLPRQEGNNFEKSDGSQSEGSLTTVIPEIKCETRVNDSEDSADCTKKRGRPRRKPDSESVSETIETPRTLRTRVKRWYVESDEETEGNKDVPSYRKGTVSDSKEEEN